MMLALTPLVDPLSIDEAFLDLSGTARLHGMSAAKALAHFAADVETKLRITVSIGLSCNKFLAKVASDLDKPRGFAVLGRGEALDFLAPKSVGLIWGVGAALQQKLARDGITTIGELRQRDERELRERRELEAPGRDTFEQLVPRPAARVRQERGREDDPVPEFGHRLQREDSDHQSHRNRGGAPIADLAAAKGIEIDPVAVGPRGAHPGVLVVVLAVDELLEVELLDRLGVGSVGQPGQHARHHQRGEAGVLRLR